MTTKERACAECGGTMRKETRPDTLSYKGKSKVIQSFGWWCDGCGEAILEGEALIASEKAFVELKAEVDEVLTAKQVSEVREKLGLSQREASKILGGGPRAFQKYEAGAQPVSMPMNNLLRLLANDPKRIDELKMPLKRT